MLNVSKMEFLKKLTNFFKKFCESFRREKTFENKQINASNSKSKTVYVNKNNYNSSQIVNSNITIDNEIVKDCSEEKIYETIKSLQATDNDIRQLFENDNK